MFAGIYNELVKKYSYLISDRRILNNEKVIKIQILTSALIVNLLLAVTQNQIKKELGVFKTGQFLLCPSVQLPSPDAIPGESGEGVDVTGIEIIVI